jgi:polyhydroxybutyrate depolymerase
MRRFIVAVSTLLAVAGLAKADGPSTRPATSQPAAVPVRLKPGNYVRAVASDGNARTYLLHIPTRYDANKLTPVVLAFHGAWGNGRSMEAFSGLSKKSDEAGFIVAYPNGKGVDANRFFFNAFTVPGPLGFPPDDVKFTTRILDDLASAVNVDARRVFATGMSNGAMMCHRLAAELSGRIAAIAPVSGTLCRDDIKPPRPGPVIHFHGSADPIVPFDGARTLETKLLNFKSVDETIKTWVKLDGCPEKPEITKLPDFARDGTTVTRKVYGPGKDGCEVVLYVIEGGGHTWPGRDPGVTFRGKFTRNISANDLMWEFFKKHPMPAPATQPATADK